LKESAKGPGEKKKKHLIRDSGHVIPGEGQTRKREGGEIEKKKTRKYRGHRTQKKGC